MILHSNTLTTRIPIFGGVGEGVIERLRRGMKRLGSKLVYTFSNNGQSKSENEFVSLALLCLVRDNFYN